MKDGTNRMENGGGIERRAPRKRGVVLFAVLAAIMALALMAATVATFQIASLRIAGQLLRSVEALYAADAGAQYVITRIEQDLASGVLALTAEVENVSYAAPAGMSFDTVTRLTRTSIPGVYWYRVTGHATEARCTLELVAKRLSALQMGFFGDESFEMKATGAIYSYDSSRDSSPTPEESTGQAYAGCNGTFTTHQDTMIDGSFMLGEAEDGEAGDWSELPAGSAMVTGEPAIPGDRVDPDPLGVVSGALAAEFAAAAVSNDNASVGITFPQYKLQLNNGQSLTLSSGTYYVGSIVLMNGSFLNVDASSGPVKIYLTGKCEAKEGSSINMTGVPSDFMLFSNSTKSVILKNSGSFSGVVYAPLATVQVMNSGDFYGLAWGNELELKNSGSIYMDIDAMSGFGSHHMAVTSWKELR